MGSGKGGDIGSGREGTCMQGEWRKRREEEWREGTCLGSGGEGTCVALGRKGGESGDMHGKEERTKGHPMGG